MKSQMQAFLSAIFGALVGGTSAWQFSTHWWSIGVGGAVGFATGYISFAFAEVRSAVVDAYTRVIGWQPNKTYWGRVFSLFPPSLSFMTFMIWVWVPLIGSYPWQTSITFRLGITGLVTTAIVLAFTIFMGLLGAIIEERKDDEERFNRLLSQAKRMSREFNAITMWFTLGKLLLKAPGALIRSKAVVFCVEVLKTIHSDERLIVGMSAAIGGVVMTTLGYTGAGATRTILAGVVLAALIMALSDELIARRWWKTLPQRS